MSDTTKKLIKEIKNLDYGKFGHRPPVETKWCVVTDYLAVSCPYCRILGLLAVLAGENTP